MIYKLDFLRVVQKSCSVLLAGLIFENFPVRVGALKKPTSVGFSPGGRFMCVGQCDGRAALYAFSHFKDY
ncbi:unnamed protein product [Trichobilharzia regenti]|nr:unnamed protein product [Trichobilharzia regenti]